MDRRKYWPFEISDKQVLTPEQQRQIAFLETAHSEGFNPYIDGGDSFGIRSGNRGARIFSRGRERWEIVLGFVDSQSLSAFVSTFTSASNAALDWGRGNNVDCIAARLKMHLADVPKGMQALTVSEVSRHGG